MTGLSRREFLRGLAATAVSLGLDPYAGIAVADDFYQNRRMGLSFHKPPGWEFDSVADFAAIRERQVLLSVDPAAVDTNEVDPLKDPENLPVVLIADPKRRQGNFAPAIVVWDEPHSDPTSADEIKEHWMFIEWMASRHKDVEVIEVPKALSVSGASGTQSVLSYLHELDDGEARLLEVRTLLFFRPQHVHTIYLIDDGKCRCVAPKTFEDFIHTIEYR